MKIFSNHFIVITLIFLSVNGFSQNLFTGTVVYTVEIEGDVSPIVASAIPEKIETTISNGVVREDIMGMTMIYNGKDLTLTSFIEGGKMVAVVQTLEQIIATEKIKVMEINEINETKQIDGYSCNKVVIRYLIDNQELVQSLYYTPNINIGDAYQLRAIFRDIAGFPLEYEIYMKGARLIFKAVKIEEKKVNKRLFEIPKGYTISKQD